MAAPRVEASLRRLRLERIDLYQLHGVDSAVPLEESIGTLGELRLEGKISHIGLCNVDAEQIRRAQAMIPIASVQNRYNLLDRSRQDVLALCEHHHIPFICWFPLAGGELVHGGRGLARLVAARGASSSQIALAWLLHRSSVTLPIPGTSSSRHLGANVAAVGITLSKEEMAILENHRRTGTAQMRRAAQIAFSRLRRMRFR